MQESQRPGVRMCAFPCTPKWQTFFKCLWTRFLPPLSPSLKPTDIIVARLVLLQPICQNSILI